MADTSKDFSTKASIKGAYKEKRYEYRIYDDGVYNTTWASEVISEPSFRAVINGGPGEMIVKLARSFDDFGEDDDVKLFNKVECWCFDKQAANGVLVYTGFISGYRPILDRHSEYVEITLLHYIAEMSNIMLRDGNDTSIAMNSTDPSTMFTNIVDYYRVDGGEINYTGTSVDTTSTTVSYTFNCYSVKEGLDKVIELTPQNWYWRVDADNTAHLHESNMNVANHTFRIGKHINYMETWRRAEDIINTVYFVGQEDGGTPMYRVYSNTGSADSYGIHAFKKVDQRVSLTATADTMSNRIINRKKDPEIRTTITILDNNGQDSYKGYDIESIKPGQTMKIENIKQAAKTVSLWDVAQWDVDVWDQTLSYSAADILQIMSVEYSPGAVRIEAASRLPEIAKRMEDIYRNWEESQTYNAPATPTVG